MTAAARSDALATGRHPEEIEPNVERQSGGDLGWLAAQTGRFRW
jgi:hypothetical protein